MNEEYNLIRKVMASDLFIGDTSITHRILGLEFINKSIECPRIALIAYQYQDIILTKHLAFRYGKPIFTNNNFSARLFRYTEGTELYEYEDLYDAGKIFSRFINQTSKNHERF